MKFPRLLNNFNRKASIASARGDHLLWESLSTTYTLFLMHAIIFTHRCGKVDKKLYLSAILLRKEIACTQHCVQEIACTQHDPTRFKIMCGT